MIAAGLIGNVLEWYDFAIYGYFATAIGRHFFPHEDAVAQPLSAFGVFALGYLMRPVGGVVIGHIGDRFGRRAALTFSVAASDLKAAEKLVKTAAKAVAKAPARKRTTRNA